jgi:hypothetical protein
MYSSYAKLYRKNQVRYTPPYRGDYTSDLQPCNKDIPVGSICCPNYLPCSCSNNATNTVKCMSCDYQRSDYPCASNFNYYPEYTFPSILPYNDMAIYKYKMATVPEIDLYNPKLHK